MQLLRKGKQKKVLNDVSPGGFLKKHQGRSGRRRFEEYQVPWSYLEKREGLQR